MKNKILFAIAPIIIMGIVAIIYGGLIPDSIPPTINDSKDRIKPLPIVTSAFKDLPSYTCVYPPDFINYDHVQNSGRNEWLDLKLTIPDDIEIQSGGTNGRESIRAKITGANEYAYHFIIDLVYINNQNYDSPELWARSFFDWHNGDIPPPKLIENLRIAQAFSPADLAKYKGSISSNCMNNFLKEIDNIYIVDSVDSNDYKIFNRGGIWGVYGDDTAYESPYGIYATKYINDVPMLLHFNWNRDEKNFFTDKPYTPFDILWSIRFGLRPDANIEPSWPLPSSY